MTDIEGNELVAVRAKDLKAMAVFLRYGMGFTSQKSLYSTAQAHGALEILEAIFSHEHRFEGE